MIRYVWVKRQINNRFEEAIYFYNKNHDIRFVVVETGRSFLVKTAERPRKSIFSGSSLSAKRDSGGKKSRRRQRRGEKRDRDDAYWEEPE